MVKSLLDNTPSLVVGCVIQKRFPNFVQRQLLNAGFFYFTTIMKHPNKKLPLVTECNIEEVSKKGSGPAVLFNWTFDQLGALSKCFTTVKTTTY